MNPLDSIVNVIPAKYHSLAILAVAIAPYVTRTLHALVNGRGLRGALGAVWFGTNTPASAPETPRAKITVPLMLIASLLLLPIIGSGCQTAETVAYQATSTASVTVSGAMQFYSAYLKAHPPGTPGALTDAQRAKVRDAYIRYQNCMVEVIDAEEVVIASTGTNSAGTNAPVNVQANALAAADQALADLITLLQSFGIKIS